MAEHAADFEWRIEGEEAEVVLYAPARAVAHASFDRVLPAARLPGTVDPVYAASSTATPGPPNFGWVAASESHAAPDLVGAPGWGMLLVAEAPVERVGETGEVPRLVGRAFSEVALPGIGDAEVRALSESGAVFAAEEGLIEEDDLPFFAAGGAIADADALGRRALSAGARDWTRRGGVRALRVAEVPDLERAGSLGLDPGLLALVVGTGAGDLGRLALAAHRDRISARVLSGSFDAPTGLPAAPTDAEEARDLLVASYAAANYTAGRAALILYALRRALRDATALSLRAAWPTGGFEEKEGRVLHRNNLAVVGAGEALVAGRTVAAGTGGMLGSAPAFEAEEPKEAGGWAWEEADILSRWAILEPLGDRSGEVTG